MGGKVRHGQGTLNLVDTRFNERHGIKPAVSTSMLDPELGIRSSKTADKCQTYRPEAVSNRG
jgi:hypothetical protein